MMTPTAPEVETGQLIILLAELIAAVDRSHPLTRTNEVTEALTTLRNAFHYPPMVGTGAQGWSNRLTASIG